MGRSQQRDLVRARPDVRVRLHLPEPLAAGALWQDHCDLDHVVQSDSHSTSLARLATGQADVMVSYGHIRIKNAPIWQEKLGGTAPWSSRRASSA
mgnify:CR=1 FL=1